MGVGDDKANERVQHTMVQQFGGLGTVGAHTTVSPIHETRGARKSEEEGEAGEEEKMAEASGVRAGQRPLLPLVNGKHF